MGDVVREETRRRGLEPDSKNTGDVMKQLRLERGDSAIAELCLEAMRESGAERLVVDGIRSMSEVEAFKKSAKVILIAVQASQSRRFALLRERGRSDDPLSYGMFLEREERELDVGIGDAIALADEVVLNEHTSPDKLANEILEVVDRWVKKEKNAA